MDTRASDLLTKQISLQTHNVSHTQSQQYTRSWKMANARVEEEIKKDEISEENLLLQEDKSKNTIIRNTNFKSNNADSKSKRQGEKEKPKGEKEEEPRGEKEKKKAKKKKVKRKLQPTEASTMTTITECLASVGQVSVYHIFRAVIHCYMTQMSVIDSQISSKYGGGIIFVS